MPVRREPRNVVLVLTSPLALAVYAWLAMGGFIVYRDLSGYRGSGRPRAAPMTVAETVADRTLLVVPPFTFVMTFLVISLRVRLRR